MGGSVLKHSPDKTTSDHTLTSAKACNYLLGNGDHLFSAGVLIS